MTEGTRDSSAALATAQQRLADLSHVVARFDTRSLELSRTQSAALEECVAFAHEAVRALDDVLAATGGNVAPESRPDLPASVRGRDAQTVEGSSQALVALVQVSCVARMEITRVLERLSPPPVSADHVVHQGASLYRKVWRGVGVVEEAIARVRQTESQAAAVSSLTTSLRTRKVYAWFRRSLDVDAQPSKDSIQKAIRKIGTRIAALIGKDEYRELRPDDRILFSRLQARILQWLAQPQASFEEGRRLWEDCRAMGDILRQVNLRADLIEHDARLARTLLVGPRGVGETSHVSEDVLARLASLEGLDDELDVCFARREVPTRATVERVLTRADLAARSRGV